MDAEDSDDADRVIRQIFGHSDEESDENLEFDYEEFKDNLPLACFLPRSEESEDEEQFEMPSDEEEEEESDSEEWGSDVITHDDFDFDESSVGLKVRMLPNKSALDFFELIFTDDLHNLIITETNRYATQQRKEPRNQKMPWTTLTIEEFKTWLGLYLSMGIVQQPSLMNYWTQSTLTKTPGIAAVMTRTRFLQILRYLQFIDNDSEVAKLPKDSPDYDKLYKIRDLLNIIRRNIQGH